MEEVGKEVGVQHGSVSILPDDGRAIFRGEQGLILEGSIADRRPRNQHGGGCEFADRDSLGGSEAPMITFTPERGTILMCKFRGGTDWVP